MNISSTWDRYARLTLAGLQGPPPAFGWTPVLGHGPGAELLGVGHGSAVLELGCGKGDRLAYVAGLGARAVGVDISAVQVAAASARWGTTVELHHADAVHYLRHTSDTFDAIFSVFGAHWFTDPEKLLPAVRPRLREGGVVVLAHVPPGADIDPNQFACTHVREDVLRWEGESSDWAEALRRHGLGQPTVTVIEPPYSSGGVRTVILAARE